MNAVGGEPQRAGPDPLDRFDRVDDFQDRQLLRGAIQQHSPRPSLDVTSPASCSPCSTFDRQACGTSVLLAIWSVVGRGRIGRQIDDRPEGIFHGLRNHDRTRKADIDIHNSVDDTSNVTSMSTLRDPQASFHPFSSSPASHHERAGHGDD